MFLCLNIYSFVLLCWLTVIINHRIRIGYILVYNSKSKVSIRTAQPLHYPSSSLISSSVASLERLLIIKTFWFSWNLKAILSRVQDCLDMLDQPILLLLDFGILFARLLN
jgi:hypothetical protein